MNNIYTKVILTVISIELGIMIFKKDILHIPMNDSIQDRSAVVQTKFDMPNAGYNTQDEPIKVVIVDVNMKQWTGAYKSMLPVSLCKPANDLQAAAVSYPLPVKNSSN
jgi:hypothetical protein